MANERGGDDERRPAVLNAWIAIHGDGAVTFTCPRNEMGQDVTTSLAMLLAEELAVDPRRITVSEAPADPVYLNKLVARR
jgi:CO/xanthine dehydrogenase Mo-binding subunit